MYFVVTFSVATYKDDKEIELDTEKKFLVEAQDKNSARNYAKRFEHIATGWTRGLFRVKSVEVARSNDVEALPKLSDYELIFPNR